MRRVVLAASVGLLVGLFPTVLVGPARGLAFEQETHLVVSGATGTENRDALWTIRHRLQDEGWQLAGVEEVSKGDGIFFRIERSRLRLP